MKMRPSIHAMHRRIGKALTRNVRRALTGRHVWDRSLVATINVAGDVPKTGKENWPWAHRPTTSP